MNRKDSRLSCKSYLRLLRERKLKMMMMLRMMVMDLHHRLYQKATRAGLHVTKANQDEILCWYKYAEGFESRVRDIRSQDTSVTNPTARSQAYHEVSQHLPGITEANLHKKTQKARNIYKVFVRIEISKIKWVKSYSADAISNLSSTQIQSIIDRFSTT
jgi:hypothetical protein